MVEVFGIVAGAIGILPLGAQFVKGVKTLRKIRTTVGTATAQLDDLISDLEFLQHVLEGVESAERSSHGGSNHPLILERCRADCANVLAGLEALQNRFPMEQSGQQGMVPKRRLLSEAPRMLKFMDWKDEAQILHDDVRKAKQDLLLKISLMSIFRTQTVYDGVRTIVDQLPNNAKSQDHQAPHPLPPADDSPTQTTTDVIPFQAPRSNVGH
ncbi:hypothetical protein PspLS_06359 [Pyricularia sp. CBS 133598]|nr:hypothetical protein PspLS_06359 [Pyricularia sp. CBS 133598]